MKQQMIGVVCTIVVFAAAPATLAQTTACDTDPNAVPFEATVDPSGLNALLPGPTRTENTERLRAERAKAAGMSVQELEADFFRSFRPTSILKRFTSAEEVANLAVYLCSEASSATTGAALRADGGVVNQIM